MIGFSPGEKVGIFDGKLGFRFFEAAFATLQGPLALGQHVKQVGFEMRLRLVFEEPFFAQIFVFFGRFTREDNVLSRAAAVDDGVAAGDRFSQWTTRSRAAVAGAVIFVERGHSLCARVSRAGRAGSAEAAGK